MPRQKIYIPPNKDIERLMDQLLNNRIGFIKPPHSKSFGRHKTIRRVRNELFIGHDFKKNIDVVYCPNLKIKKNGKGYIFL